VLLYEYGNHVMRRLYPSEDDAIYYFLYRELDIDASEAAGYRIFHPNSGLID
jgi:hypothetical protein